MPYEPPLPSVRGVIFWPVPVAASATRLSNHLVAMLLVPAGLCIHDMCTDPVLVVRLLQGALVHETIQNTADQRGITNDLCVSLRAALDRQIIDSHGISVGGASCRLTVVVEVAIILYAITAFDIVYAIYRSTIQIHIHGTCNSRDGRESKAVFDPAYSP